MSFPLFIHPDDRSIVLYRHLMRLKGETPETIILLGL